MRYYKRNPLLIEFISKPAGLLKTFDVIYTPQAYGELYIKKVIRSFVAGTCFSLYQEIEEWYRLKSVPTYNSILPSSLSRPSRIVAGCGGHPGI